jgi:hypothetical protein
MVMTDENHDDTLAHDMIEVHGTGGCRGGTAKRQHRGARRSGHSSKVLDPGAWDHPATASRASDAVGNSPNRSADDTALRKINVWI